MDTENLSPERKEELRAAKTAEELERISKEEGSELCDDMLDGVSGGYTNCTGYHKEDPYERCPSWCAWKSN